MLAIVCSLLLTGTPVLAQAPAAGIGRVAHACCHCGKACCAVPASPESQPVPAAPAPSPSQNQLLILSPAVLLWIQPATRASEFSASIYPPLMTHRTPLYTRNCAFLI
jgi:hypothetical protein